MRVDPVPPPLMPLRGSRAQRKRNTMQDKEVHGATLECLVCSIGKNIWKSNEQEESVDEERASASSSKPKILKPRTITRCGRSRHQERNHNEIILRHVSTVQVPAGAEDKASTVGSADIQKCDKTGLKRLSRRLPIKYVYFAGDRKEGAM